MSMLSDQLKGSPLGPLMYDPTDDKEAALGGLGQIQAAYGNLNVPGYTPINYEGPTQAANVSVNPITSQGMGDTAYSGMQANQGDVAAQQAQLSALQQLQANGGMTAADNANLANIRQGEAQQEKSQRDAILQNAHMRGMANSNMGLMAQLNANQGAATRQNQSDMSVAAQAQNNSLNAGSQAASLAGNMQNQNWNEQAQMAAARDAASKFNAQTANATNQFNNQQSLQSQLANQNISQGVNNANANAYNNSQTMNNYTMPNTNFSQGATKAAGQAGAGKAQMDYYNNQQAAGAAAKSGVLGGGLQTGMGVGTLGLGAYKAGMFNSTPAEGASNGSMESATGSGDPWGSGVGDASSSGMAAGSESAMFDRGGMVPGSAIVSNDSPINDLVKARLSPGEVVVPRSLVNAPNDRIGSFVHHAERNPAQLETSQNEKNKAAMLAALKQLRRR